MPKMEPLKWIQSLQAYIYTTITPLVEQDEAKRLNLVSERAMVIWSAAFTDKSYNPNYGFNYEILEKIGDSALKLTFSRMLQVRFPTISESQLSELVSYYLSKVELSSISKSLGINNHIRTLLDKNINVFEDVLEAIYGALMEIGDRIYQVGVGYILCYNLTLSLWNNKEISMSVAEGDAKTQVTQIFQRLRWGKPGEEDVSSVFKVLATNEAIKAVAELGQTLPKVLGSGKNPSKDVRSKIAYKLALKTLNKLGITLEWAIKQRQLLDYSNPELKGILEKLKEKSSKEGFVDTMFNTVKKTQTHIFIQLIGIKEDGYKQTLSTVSIPTVGKKVDMNAAKIEAINAYLNST
jgi:dsRNA-specific ribonuclease